MRWLLLALLACLGCTEAKYPSQTDIRTTIVVVGIAAEGANAFCQAKALDVADPKLGATCAAGYVSTKSALAAARNALDTYDEAAAGQAACAIVSGLDGIDNVVHAMEAAKVDVPKWLKDSVTDAKLIASWALTASGGVCHAQP